MRVTIELCGDGVSEPGHDLVEVPTPPMEVPVTRWDMTNQMHPFVGFFGFQQHVYQPLELSTRIFTAQPQPQVAAVSEVHVERNNAETFGDENSVVTC